MNLNAGEWREVVWRCDASVVDGADVVLVLVSMGCGTVGEESHWEQQV